MNVCDLQNKICPKTILGCYTPQYNKGKNYFQGGKRLWIPLRRQTNPKFISIYIFLQIYFIIFFLLTVHQASHNNFHSGMPLKHQQNMFFLFETFSKLSRVIQNLSNTKTSTCQNYFGGVDLQNTCKNNCWKMTKAQTNQGKTSTTPQTLDHYLAGALITPNSFWFKILFWGRGWVTCRTPAKNNC